MNIHLWVKSGTTPTQKGQETDYPFRKSSILCCSVIKFLEPRVSQFWAMKETNIKNLCCSQIIKIFVLLRNHYFYFVMRIRTNKNILLHLPCSGMTQKVQTVQGEWVLLKQGMWRVFPKKKYWKNISLSFILLLMGSHSTLQWISPMPLCK